LAEESSATYCKSLQHNVTHCNELQHTAPHCNTPGNDQKKFKLVEELGPESAEASGKKISKVSSAVIVYGRLSRELTFENFFQVHCNTIERHFENSEFPMSAHNYTKQM